jgi:hypothetical protein
MSGFVWLLCSFVRCRGGGGAGAAGSALLLGVLLLLYNNSKADAASPADPRRPSVSRCTYCILLVSSSGKGNGPVRNITLEGSPLGVCALCAVLPYS